MTALLSRFRPAAKVAHVTIAQRLSEAGIDTGTLEGRGTASRTASAVAQTHPDGTVVAGVMYVLDFRSEEEYGIGELRKALSGPDPRNVAMVKTATRNVARFADVNAIVVSSRALPTRTFAWGEDLTTGQPSAHEQDYAQWYAQSLNWARRDEFANKVEHDRLSMSDLRKFAKTLDLPGPLPRSKVALGAAILSSPQYEAARELLDVWPAWFHYGRELVLRAEPGTGATAVVIDALGEAIDAGTLAIGTYSGAFTTGVFLYDARDESDAIRAARAERADWYDARMADLEPVAAKLKSMGHGWYFLGRPSEFAKDEGGVRYWLNGKSGAVAADGTRCRRQPSGWYTLSELLEEKFVHDAAVREASDAQNAARRRRS